MAQRRHSKYSCCFCVSLSLTLSLSISARLSTLSTFRLRIAFIGFLQIFNGFQVDALFLSSHFIILFVPPSPKGLPAIHSRECSLCLTTRNCQMQRADQLQLPQRLPKVGREARGGCESWLRIVQYEPIASDYYDCINWYRY